MPNPLQNESSSLQTLQSKSDGHGRTFTLSYHDNNDLTTDLLEWALQLVKCNMREMYENCEWGWDPQDKLKELKSRHARFLIAYELDERNGDKLPIGFVHFRFVMDYGRRVVYCYELQVEAGAKGHGIGSRFMKLLELFALREKRPLVVLTCLKANADAIAFYKKLGYDIDETNPGKSENRPYFIFQIHP